MRRASPVAWRVLVTVLPLPPRRRDTACQPTSAASCCLRLSSCRLGLQGHSLSGPPLRSLALRPGDSPSSCDDVVDGLQVIDFSPPCHLATRVLAVPLAGLSPAEHASLSWTHNRACHFHSTRLSTFRSVLVFALWHDVHSGWRCFMRSASVLSLNRARGVSWSISTSLGCMSLPQM